MSAQVKSVSRREFLTAMGGVVVSFAIPMGDAEAATVNAAVDAGPWPEKIAADALDSWLVEIGRASCRERVSVVV